MDPTKMTEAEMRQAEIKTPETIEELMGIVRSVTERSHDYGTCVYAMSIAAEAAFKFVAGKLGVTVLQSSSADMDFIRRTRGYEHGFRVIDYSKLLYPQYDRHLRITPESLLADERLRKSIADEARKLLATDRGSSSVRNHWEKLASMAPITDGE